MTKTEKDEFYLSATLFFSWLRKSAICCNTFAITLTDCYDLCCLVGLINCRFLSPNLSWQASSNDSALLFLSDQKLHKDCLYFFFHGTKKEKEKMVKNILKSTFPLKKKRIKVSNRSHNNVLNFQYIYNSKIL